ncbi:MAG TPA: hypothetical protein VGN23_06875 [Verrucomicrobiae bacterium]|jgi:hypothetical protein
MKRIVVLLAAGALCAGCVSTKNGLVLNTVGPVPSPAGETRSTTGTLVVYSAYDVNADFNSRDPNRPEYSDYRIYSDDGKLLQRVHNDSGTIFQDPKRVTLPVGTYRVIARANGFGYVTIPVTVAPQQTTLVRLAGNWSASYHFDDTDAVRLPDGQIVGYRSTNG